jgi:hypothetical protein
LVHDYNSADAVAWTFTKTLVPTDTLLPKNDALLSPIAVIERGVKSVASPRNPPEAPVAGLYPMTLGAALIGTAKFQVPRFGYEFVTGLEDQIVPVIPDVVDPGTALWLYVFWKYR